MNKNRTLNKSRTQSAEDKNKKKVSGPSVKTKTKAADPCVARMRKKYQIAESAFLGDGAFSQVFKARNRETKVLAACKITDRSKVKETDVAAINNEAKFLRHLYHENIVKYYDKYECQKKIYVFLECMACDMSQEIMDSKLERFDERLTKFLMKQIITAVNFIHDQDLVHRDLKPENVLFDYKLKKQPLPLIKLCDFGAARHIAPLETRGTVIGTPQYSAPQVLNEEKYDRNTDIWSLGVIIYVSLSGTYPFVGGTMKEIHSDVMLKISEKKQLFGKDRAEHIKKAARNYIALFLSEHEADRITADEALNHKWLHDFQLFKDLRQLEKRIGKRFMYTSEEEENKWKKEYQR